MNKMIKIRCPFKGCYFFVEIEEEQIGCSPALPNTEKMARFFCDHLVGAGHTHMLAPMLWLHVLSNAKRKIIESNKKTVEVRVERRVWGPNDEYLVLGQIQVDGQGLFEGDVVKVIFEKV